MGRLVWLLAGVCLALALGAQAQQGEALPQWAVDIAQLMGGTGTPVSDNPNGITVKHDKGRPADGLVVKGKTAEEASPYTYIYEGPVTAAPGSLPIVQQHPYAVLAVQMAAFLKLAKYMDKKKSHSPLPPPVPEYLVQVSNGNFVVGIKCRNLYPAGLNKAEFVEAAAGAPRLFDAKLEDPFFLTGPETVRILLDQAKTAGLDLLRVNFFAVDAQYSVLTQSEPGVAPVAKEALLQGMDYILSEAQKRGIRVLPVLTDHFRDQAGGPLQYLAFAGVDTTCNQPSSPSCDAVKSQFYTHALAKTYFKDYISTLINRVNSINGRAYKEDPTIWGWDIMNEPRCTESSCVDLEARTSTIGDFVTEISAYIRTLDNKHLITVGLEGWYLYAPGNATNPFADAQNYGSDWVDVNAIANIDFGEFNVYPDIYKKNATDADKGTWLNVWTEQHSADAKNPLAKPAIIKEFGMAPTALREPFYELIVNKALDTVTDDRTEVGGLKGAVYWLGWIKETNAAWFLGNPAGRYGILPANVAYGEIEKLSAGSEALERTLACPSGEATNELLRPIFFTTPSCPAGFEGPDCIDINECVRGTDNCDEKAACINTEGSFSCQCFLTFIGAGTTGTCFANPAVTPADILAKFETFPSVPGDPSSTPARSDKIGDDFTAASSFVPYPKTGPGYKYDPTGYYESTSLLVASSRRANMTVEECALACDSVPALECTSFFYNEADESCILKKGECFNEANLVLDTPAICTADVFEDGNLDPILTDFEYVCGFGYTYFRKGSPLPTGCDTVTPS